jgi:hypothetical protein
MPHDKIKSAARARRAQTGEPYAAARRAVQSEHRDAGRSGPQPPEPRLFLIRYRQAGLDRPTAWFDTLLGPDRAGRGCWSARISYASGWEISGSPCRGPACAR